MGEHDLLFASEEWAEAFARAINASEAIAREAHGFNASVQWVIQGAGERGDLRFWIDIGDGRMIKLMPGEREAEFTVSGPYSLWRQIAEGEVDPLESIIDKRMSFEGDLPMLMRYMGMLDSLIQTVRSIPTRF